MSRLNYCAIKSSKAKIIFFARWDHGLHSIRRIMNYLKDTPRGSIIILEARTSKIYICIRALTLTKHNQSSAWSIINRDPIIKNMRNIRSGNCCRAPTEPNNDLLALFVKQNRTINGDLVGTFWSIIISTLPCSSRKYCDCNTIRSYYKLWYRRVNFFPSHSFLRRRHKKALIRVRNRRDFENGV